MAKPYQFNISPSEETLELLDELVAEFGPRHRNARNRNGIAAEVLERYLPVWANLMRDHDARVQADLDMRMKEVTLRQS